MSAPIVTVYTTGPGCARCTATKRRLDHLGVPYTEVPISGDEKIVAAIRELGFTTAPVVVAATAEGEQAWDGYRPDRIDALAVVS